LKPDPLQSDLRECASEEPKREPPDSGSECSENRENRKRSFNDLVTGLQRKRVSAPDYLKLVQILREMTPGLE